MPQEELIKMPAGSMPPEIPPETTPDTGNVSPDVNASVPDQNIANQPILGKFKSVGELEKGYKEIESRFGAQSNELAGMKNQVSMLTNLIKATKQNTQTPQPPQSTQNDELSKIDAEIRDVAAKADTGDLTSGEATLKAAELATKKASIIAQSHFEKMMHKQNAESVQREFIKENPDFKTLLDSGQLDQIKSTNPMHDNFSAYFAYKAMQEKQNLSNVEKTAYDKGMQDGSKLKDGSIPASKVLSKPGTNVRQVNNSTTPISDLQKRQGMMDVLAQMRGGVVQ